MKEASDFENQIWGGECLQKILPHAEAGQNVFPRKWIRQGLGGGDVIQRVLMIRKNKFW